jgi:HNH endonuclease
MDRFEQKYIPEPNSGCFLWMGSMHGPKGYGAFWINGRPRKAHHVSWEIQNGPIPSGRHVLHSCDTPSCVNTRHLFLGTNNDNVMDKVAKGRQARGRVLADPKRGEGNPQSKLTEDHVRAIRLDPNSGRQIAQKYGLSEGTVSQIRSRQLWRHVE